DGAASGSEVFFPVDVSFTSCRTVAKVQVVEVVRTETGTPVRFSQESRLVTESYTVPA
ncbi:coatomer delta subunit, putative, partial [Trypanosoma cruzi]